MLLTLNEQVITRVSNWTQTENHTKTGMQARTEPEPILLDFAWTQTKPEQKNITKK